MNFPVVVKWAITDKCNLKCKHCYKNNHVNEITKEDVDLIIQELKRKGIGCVALTGGEPLVAKQFMYIVQELHKYGIETEIASNGFMMSDKMIDYLFKNNIKVVQISIDGYDGDSNDYIRGKGVYDIVTENIRNIVCKGIKVVLAHTLNHYNCNDIERIISLADELGVSAIRLERYIPVMEDKYKLRLDRNDIEFVKNCSIKYLDRKNIVFPIFHENSNCGAGEYMVMINSDMTLSPCDLLSDFIRSDLMIDDNHSIEYIWNNDIILNNWRKNKYIGCKLVDD